MKTVLEQSWRDFFESGFYETGWEMVTDQDKTDSEVRGILEILKPKPGSHILDWCGGWGRHSIGLAERGFQVTLLDYTLRHLQRAKMMMKKKSLKHKIKLVHKDFRFTPSYIQADYAVNLFTAGLGYLTEEDDVFALESLHSALKPEAKILIDTMNLFWLVKNYKEEDTRWSSDQSVYLTSERTFDFLSNRNLSREVLFTISDPVGIRNLNHRIYSLSELAQVLKRANFKVEAYFGDFDQTPFGFDSKRLIVIASKV